MKKETKIVLGIIGGLLVVCLIIGAIAAYSAQQVFTRSVKMYEEPEKIAELAREIVDYELPPGYREAFGMSLFGFDMVGMGSGNNSASDQTLIFLAQFPKSLGVDRAEMQQQMEQSVQRQSGRRDMQLTVVDEVTVTIRDQTVPLAIREGTDAQGNPIRQVTGVFEGKNGTVMLMIMGNTQKWDQPAIDAFINSLR